MWDRVLFAGLARAVLLFGVAATAAPPENARAAGAAYVVDTADVSEPGTCKVESWISTASNHDFFAATTPTCVVDVFRPVELSSELIRTRADAEWASGIAPKIKTNLVPTAIGSWGIAISGAAAYDLTNQQTVAMFATVPATLRLSNVLRINLNAGWEWDRIAGQHYATYAAGVDWRTPDNVWTLTAEVFGQLGARQDAIGVTEPRFQVGLRWRPIDDFNVDLIYGRNVYGEKRKLDHARDRCSLSRGAVMDRDRRRPLQRPIESRQLLESRYNGRGIVYYVGFVLIILGPRRNTVIVH